MSDWHQGLTSTGLGEIHFFGEVSSPADHQFAICFIEERDLIRFAISLRRGVIQYPSIGRIIRLTKGPRDDVDETDGMPVCFRLDAFGSPCVGSSFSGGSYDPIPR